MYCARRFVVLAFLCWAFACVLSGCGSKFEVPISKARVVSRIEQKFPMTQGMFLAVTVAHPTIDFNGSKDCLDVNADVTVRMLGILPTKGKAKISCKLVYKPEKKSIFLGDVVVHEFNMNGLPKGKYDEIFGLVGTMVVPTLGTVEAYHFDENSRLEKMASAYVKGFRVTDENLIVILGYH